MAEDKPLTEFERIELMFESIGKGEFFDEEAYLESRQQVSSVKSQITNIIVHIFKFKYGNDPISHDHLRTEIYNFRREIIKITNWNTKKEDKNLLRDVNEITQDAYDDAISDLKSSVKKYHKDYKITYKQIRYLPKEIPWVLEDLLGNEIEILLEELPDTVSFNFMFDIFDEEE